MRADEIRKLEPHATGSPGAMYQPNMVTNHDLFEFGGRMLQEIAAQLAKMNERSQPPDLSKPQHLWTDEEYRIAAARQQAVVSSHGQPAPAAAPPVNDRCVVNRSVDRICELGTKGCTVGHFPPDVDLEPPAEPPSEPDVVSECLHKFFPGQTVAWNDDERMRMLSALRHAFDRLRSVAETIVQEANWQGCFDSFGVGLKSTLAVASTRLLGQQGDTEK